MISVAVIPTCKLTECDLECSVSGHTNNMIRAKSLFGLLALVELLTITV
jgi:hypothetical protein